MSSPRYSEMGLAAATGFFSMYDATIGVLCHVITFLCELNYVCHVGIIHCCKNLFVAWMHYQIHGGNKNGGSCGNYLVDWIWQYQRKINTTNPDVKKTRTTFSAFMPYQKKSLLLTVHSIFSSSRLYIFFHHNYLFVNKFI